MRGAGRAPRAWRAAADKARAFAPARCATRGSELARVYGTGLVQVASRALKLVPPASTPTEGAEGARDALRCAALALRLLGKVRACLAFKPLDLERMQYALVVKAAEWAMVRVVRARSRRARTRARARTHARRAAAIGAPRAPP